MGLFKGFG